MATSFQLKMELRPILVSSPNTILRNEPIFCINSTTSRPGLHSKC